LKDLREFLTSYFTQTSGGKTILLLRRAGVVTGGAFLALTLVMAWLGPAQDRTFYTQTRNSESGQANQPEIPGRINQAIVALFNSGKRKNEAAQKNRKAAIKYLAPQVLGAKVGSQRTMRSGAKLVGFLVAPIDTRSPAAVRARISRGGESGGVEIAAGSVLTGQYSYGGTGDRVYIAFERLDTPEGQSRRIQAHALDSGTFTPGIAGVFHSEGGMKLASQLGLSMFSAMTDTLTEKESLGFSQNAVQAKPTMKNALLQGLSRASQDQSSQTSAKIESVKDYAVVPDGKEMIIELTEDYK
jgi:hypothetical protein